MFILRSILDSDFEDLFNLSKNGNFINLPQDQNKIKNLIESSLKSQINPSKNLSENYYIFGLEDLREKKIIGVSMIHGQHGTKEKPHVYLKLNEEKHTTNFKNLQTEYHTIELLSNSNGWSEIGGLVLDPKYRGNTEKLGKQLSFVRFLYLGLNSDRFTPIIHSELLPPFDDKGSNSLYESFGKKFLGIEYQDADKWSIENPQLLLDLLPKHPIPTCLFSEEANRTIGEVGPFTKPVKNMLEKIGFQFTNEVDPLDGGPHYRANVQDILPIKNLFHAIPEYCPKDFEEKEDMLLSIPSGDNLFKAVKIKGKVKKDPTSGLKKIKMSPEDFNYFFTDLKDPIPGIYL